MDYAAADPLFCRPKRVIYGLMALIFLYSPPSIFGTPCPNCCAACLNLDIRCASTPLHALLHAIGNAPSGCLCYTLIIFAGVIGWRWFAHASDSIDRHFRWILGTPYWWPHLTFLVFDLLLPFVCLRPSLAWLSFSVSAAAYFFVWTQEPWGLSPLQQSLFGDLFCGGNYELGAPVGVFYGHSKSRTLKSLHRSQS